MFEQSLKLLELLKQLLPVSVMEMSKSGKIWRKTAEARESLHFDAGKVKL